MKTGYKIAVILMTFLIILFVNVMIWMQLRKKINHLQKKVADLQVQFLESEHFIDNFYSFETLVGRRLNTVLGSRPEEFDQILVANESRQLILTFSQESCLTCVISQLRMLDKIQALVADKKSIRILGITDASPAWTSRFIRTFTLHFPIYTDVNFNPGFRDKLPLITLIDKGQSILAAHHPVPGKSHFSLVFYGIIRDQLHLSSSLFDFKNIRPSDIVTQRVTLSDYADLVY